MDPQNEDLVGCVAEGTERGWLVNSPAALAQTVRQLVQGSHAALQGAVPAGTTVCRNLSYDRVSNNSISSSLRRCYWIQIVKPNEETYVRHDLVRDKKINFFTLFSRNEN